MSIIPFTLVVMKRTNHRLLVDVEGRELGDEELRMLVKRWGWLNLARGIGPLVGSVVGGLALVRALRG